jgi:ribosomal protein S24E
MSIIETITDVSNAFLSRRELTCNFAGLGGKLKSLEAADMITKEFKLDGKVVIPMRLKTQVGKSLITGTFYIYEDEALAKKHVNPTIFARIEKTKAKLAEAETAAKEAETAAKEAETAAKEAEAPPAEAAKEAEAPPAEETKKEEKTE